MIAWALWMIHFLALTAMVPVAIVADCGYMLLGSICRWPGFLRRLQPVRITIVLACITYAIIFCIAVRTGHAGLRINSVTLTLSLEHDSIWELYLSSLRASLVTLVLICMSVARTGLLLLSFPRSTLVVVIAISYLYVAARHQQHATRSMSAS